MDERLKVRLDLWQLEIFCTVAESKSFSQAAKALFLSQPTVTAHINALQKRLGVKLFDRMGHRVTLTGVGEVFYRRARVLLSEHERTLQELSQFLSGLSGTLTFGASNTCGQYILPSLLAHFHRKFPTLQLKMRIGSSRNILDKVLSDELELGIIGSYPEEKHLNVFQLWEDEIVLVVAPSHGWAMRGVVSASELPQQPFVLYEEGSGTRAVLEQFLAEQGLSLRTLKIVAEVGGTEAVKNFVAVSDCVGAVSVQTVENETERKHLAVVRFSEGHIVRHFWGITSDDRTPSPACRTFLQFLGSWEMGN